MKKKKNLLCDSNIFFSFSLRYVRFICFLFSISVLLLLYYTNYNNDVSHFMYNITVTITTNKWQSSAAAAAKYIHTFT